MPVLHESSSIIRALDQENFDQIAIDRSKKRFYGFDLDAYQKGSKKEKIEAEKKLIRTWREISQLPKVENALMDIWNEGVSSDSRHPVKIDTSEVEDISEKKTNLVREEMENAFSRITKMLRFRTNGSKIFKDWYIDGRLYVYYELSPKDDGGKRFIKEIRFLDPMKIELVEDGSKMTYIYHLDEPVKDKSGKETHKLEIPYNRVLFIPSGLKSADGIWLSYLNKSVRPINLLQMLENSLVIHRFVRAPERWVFRVDVSNMNKKRAKSFIQNMISKYRSKYQINPVTGEMSSENTIMAMQENIFLPKTNSQNGGHDIDTIGGNSSYGDIDDILYWKSEVESALNLPETKNGEAMFNFGSRIEEISRSEWRWFKFIKWLRSYFNLLFTRLVGIELVQSNVLTEKEFDEYGDDIYYIYENDSIYEEAKNSQKLELKLEQLSNYGELAEQWYGEEWVYQNILKESAEDAKKYMKNREEYKKKNADQGGF